MVPGPEGGVQAYLPQPINKEALPAARGGVGGCGRRWTAGPGTAGAVGDRSVGAGLDGGGGGTALGRGIGGLSQRGKVVVGQTDCPACDDEVAGSRAVLGTLPPASPGAAQLEPEKSLFLAAPPPPVVQTYRALRGGVQREENCCWLLVRS